MKNECKNSKPNRENRILFPINPYHIRVKNYEEARRRIFCEDIEISEIQKDTAKKMKRNTLRRRKYCASKKEFKKIFMKCINSITTKKNDMRPYLTVEIFGMKVGALLDSGATISCLCGNAAKIS